MIMVGVFSYFCAVAGISFLDYFAGREVSLWVLLLAPIALASWNLGSAKGGVVAFVAGAFVLASGLIGGNPYSGLQFFLFAFFSKMVVFALTVVVIGRLRRREVSRVFVPGSAK